MKNKDTRLPDHGRSAEASYDERITIRTREGFLEEIDDLVEEGVYSNRSEAFRELAEEGLDKLNI
jgi:Arc/MetJ-type ribon-helix-helix transcriptional regulator